MSAKKKSKGKQKRVLDIIIETPRGHRNKFKFDENSGDFCLGSVLPAGFAFPYDFGFVPNTRAQDGDPLDVLLLMDEPAFPGCRVRARIIGVIEAEQTEDGKTVRNDRLIAVAEEAQDYANIRSLKDINTHLLKELEQFFISYNQTRKKIFRLLATRGPAHACKLLQASLRKQKFKKAKLKGY